MVITLADSVAVPVSTVKISSVVIDESLHQVKHCVNRYHNHRRGILANKQSEISLTELYTRHVQSLESVMFQPQISWHQRVAQYLTNRNLNI